MFLLVTAVLCTQLIEGNLLSHEREHTLCSNNSTCPTWFICDNTNKCQCENEHDKIVVCDGYNLSSAVLDCNCVTYDKDIGSTYLGECFYNCENLNRINKDTIYKELPKTPEMLLNNQSAITSTGQLYCVVIVKMDIVHLYSHTISVVSSVQMVIKTGGSLS